MKQHKNRAGLFYNKDVWAHGNKWLHDAFINDSYQSAY